MLIKLFLFTKKPSPPTEIIHNPYRPLWCRIVRRCDRCFWSIWYRIVRRCDWCFCGCIPHVFSFSMLAREKYTPFDVEPSSGSSRRLRRSSISSSIYLSIWYLFTWKFFFIYLQNGSRFQWFCRWLREIILIRYKC